ncbi:MAG: fibronectin type III domain-containing protein, partial [Tepidisphaeraceae bacterium]
MSYSRLPRVRNAVVRRPSSCAGIPPAPAPRGIFEPLEARAMFTVSLGSDGWTDIAPSADTRVVYVSNSGGSDSNNGLSSNAPVKTIAKARTLVRSGSPDWMLLKRGDEWSENLDKWNRSGRSEEEPMLISAYGSGERPLLKTGSSVGFKNSGQVSHLAIIGIHFHAHTRDTDSSSYNGTTAGGYGFHSMGRLDDVLVEDTVFDDYKYNLSVTGYDARITDFELRRSIVTDAWSDDGKSQGMYVHKVDGLLLEGNVFDHNGWNTAVAGAKATIFSHGIYMSSDNSNVVVRENIIADSASHGVQARSGGVIENNLFLRNPINLLFGGGSPTVKPGGVSGRITGNVILDSRDINGSNRGNAIDLANIADVVVANNIIAADTHRHAAAINFGTTADAANVSEAVGINDLTFRDNIIYDWYSSFSLSSQFKAGGSGNLSVNNLTIEDNDFQLGGMARLMRLGTGKSGEIDVSGNRYDNYDNFPSSGWFLLGNTTTSFSSWKSNVEPTAEMVEIPYADPGRSIATYNASIGGTAAFSTFISEAADQAQGSFDARYSAAAVINYVRKGFAEGGVVPGGLLPLPGKGSLPGEVDPDPDPDPGTDTSAPSAPGTLRATGASDTTVDMNWIASIDNVGVAGYDIYRGGQKIATVSGSTTSYTDTGLNPSTAYLYTMRAFDAAGNVSSSSNSDTGTTLAGSGNPTDTAAPTAPGTLRATG